MIWAARTTGPPFAPPYPPESVIDLLTKIRQNDLLGRKMRQKFWNFKKDIISSAILRGPFGRWSRPIPPRLMEMRCVNYSPPLLKMEEVLPEVLLKPLLTFLSEIQKWVRKWIWK